MNSYLIFFLSQLAYTSMTIQVYKKEFFFQPAGLFVLENAKVQVELSGGQFAFSIIFSDDPDKKHMFSARSEGAVHSWVYSLKKAT